MKKFFSLFAGLLMAVMMSASSFTIDVKTLYPSEADGTKVTTLYDGVAFSVKVNDEGTNGSLYGKDKDVRDWRVYQSNHACVTIEAKSENALHAISVIYTYDKGGTLFYGGHTVSSDQKVRSGDAKLMHLRVDGNGSGQVRISKIIVWYGDKPERDFYWEVSDGGNITTLSYDENYEGDNKYTYDDLFNNPSKCYFARILPIKLVLNANVANAVPTTGFKFFSEFYSLQTIEDLQYFNTSEITDMTSMFAECRNLTQLDLRSFNTEHVEDMTSMFYDCKALEQINLSSFNTENVTNMANMFYNCEKLKIANLSSFNTAQVTDMSKMFCSCSNLEYVDVGSFNTKKVTNMRDMFYGCEKLQELNLLSFKFDNVTNTTSMFQNCIKLERIYCKANVRGNATVTSSANMFAGCSKLKGEQGTTYNSSYLDKSWARPDGGTGNEGYFSTEAPAVYGGFSADSQGSYLYLKYSTKGSYDMTPDEWNSDSRMASITRVMLDATFKEARPTSTAHWFDGAESLTSDGLTNFLSKLNTSFTTNMEAMFFGCKSLETLDLRKWDLSAVKNTSSMFGGCNSLESIYCTYDLAQNPGLNSTDMFNGCVALEGENGTVWEDGKTDADYAHVDAEGNPGYFSAAPKEIYGVFSEDGTFTIYYDGKKELRSGVNDWWNATYAEQREAVLTIKLDKTVKKARPTSTKRWFYEFPNIDGIKSLDFLNTSEVTDMSEMFAGSEHIIDLDLTSFHTANVTVMDGLFENCHELRLIDFGDNFETDNVTSMADMFRNCYSLKRLDLSKFNTANVVYMNSMFEDCNELYTLDLNSFDVTSVEHTDEMFAACYNLAAIYCDKDWESEATQLTSSGHMFRFCGALVGENIVFDEDAANDITFAKVKDASDNDGYFRKSTGELIYGVLDIYTNTLTIRFDKDKIANDGLTPNEWYEAMYGVNPFSQMVNKVVFDESVAKARPASTKEWFYEFTNLTEIEHLDSLKTEKVWDMDLMFAMCSSLKQLDISPLDMSNVTRFQGLFAGCTDLETLDLPDKWYDYIADVSYMFFNCSALRSIYCNTDLSANLSSSAVTDNMFYGCTSLEGGAGTKCNDSDPAYAKLDGGSEDPGYFTAKYLVKFIYWNPESDNWDEKQMTVRQGEYAIPPFVPERPGYALKGWTTPDMAEGDFVTSTDILTTPVTEEITYTALYVGQKYQLTFKYLDSDGETWLNKSIVATYMEPLSLGEFTLESLPVIAGKKFVSWQYTIKDVTEEKDFDQLNGMTWNIMEDLTFTAQYKDNPGTSIDNIEQPILVGQKVLRDGRLYIVVDEKTYDATGKLVK